MLAQFIESRQFTFKAINLFSVLIITVSVPLYHECISFFPSLLSLLLWLSLYPSSLLPSFISFFLSCFEAGTHIDEDSIMDCVAKASLELIILLLLFSKF